MKLGFDAKRYFQNSTGLGNYARWLINEMANKVPSNSWSIKLFHTRKINNSTLNVFSPTTVLARKFNFLWRTRWIIKDLLKQKITVYHGTSNEIPFGIHKTNIKTVVTIHDLINKRFPKNYHFFDRFIYDKKLNYAQKYADVIVVPSKQTQNDLIHYYNTKLDKIKVIPLSIPSISKGETSKSDNYILCVSSFNKRKNLARLVEAYIKSNLTNLQLVIAGAKGDTTDELIALCQDNASIKLRFNVCKDELAKLYINALFCIYPSTFEGFGIPILEAFSYGKTIATSNISSMPEVGGKCAVYFNPNSIDEITKAIRKLNNPQIRQAQSQFIEEQLSKFNSSNILHQYLELYNSLI